MDTGCDALLLSTDFPFFLICVLRIPNSVRLHTVHMKQNIHINNTHEILRYTKYIKLIQYYSWLSLFGKSSALVTTLSLRACGFPSRSLAIPIGIKYLKASIVKTTDQNNDKKSKTVMIPLKIGSVIELTTDKNTFFIVLVINLSMYSKSAWPYGLVTQYFYIMIRNYGYSFMTCL